MILVVPCFNEGRRLPVEEFVSKADLFDEIIFVNDGSSDNTTSILDSLKERIGEHCHIQSLPTNLGKGEAIRHGVLYYLHTIEPRHKPQEQQVQQIGFTDADLSTPLTEMQRIATVQAQTRCDFLQGSRVALMGRNIQRSALKHYLGRVGATLISELLKLPIYDTQAGAKVMTMELAEKLFTEPFISRWLFDCELYLRATQLKVSFYEEPLNTWIDQTQDSKVNFVTYIQALLDLARIHKFYK